MQDLPLRIDELATANAHAPCRPLLIIRTLSDLLDADVDGMADGLPLRLMEQRDQGNRHVRDHEQREREHVANLLARRGVDGIPLDERRDGTQHEHEHHVVGQAEDN